MSATVWTIELADRSFDDLERLLTGYGISMLIDVRPDRAAPVPSDPEAAPLEELCAEAGLGYRWMGRGLTGGETADATVAAIAAIATVSDAALLCPGPGNGRCPALAGAIAALQSRGVRVLHVVGNGSAVPHEPPLPFDR